MDKKRIVIILIAVMVVTIGLIFFINKNSDKHQSLEDKYLEIFNNSKFIIGGKSKTIGDFTDNDISNINYYSFVDYENDGHIEFFVNLTGPNGTIFIFNYDGKNMYGYKVDEDINFNSVDGYSFYSGEHEGWIKYSFKKDKLLKEDILTIDEDNNKCTYKKESVNCSDIINKEIELLNSIGSKAEVIDYKNKDKE